MPICEIVKKKNNANIYSDYGIIVLNTVMGRG